MTDHPNALPVGHQLNEYRIEGDIGIGGFSITYKALYTRLDKVVAIKEYFPYGLAVRTGVAIVQPEFTADQDDYQQGLERFLDEARTLARFEHPHINHVRSVFEDNNTAYLVLEYIEGETLSALLKREGRLEESRLERLVDELLSSLDEVHSADYVHQDVKPSNIMLRKNGASVLLDFGAALQVLGQRSKNIPSILTPGYAPIEQYDPEEGDIILTPGYAPIEQYNPKEGDIGPWTDLYTLGIVAYRCVSGINETELIDAETRDQLKREGNQDQDMTPAVEVGKGLYPLSLLKAIDWAIKVERDDRPQSVAAIKEMLAGDEVPDNAPDAVPVDKPTKQPSSPKFERFWVWFWEWFGVVAVVSLLVFTFAWWWSATVERDGREEAERVVQAERAQRAAATRVARAESKWREAARRAQVEKERSETARLAQEATRRARVELAQRAADARLAQIEREQREETERVAAAQKCPKYYNNKEYGKALGPCIRSAVQGNISAQNILGIMYMNGRGVAQDGAEAVKWYRKSADQGNALGQALLGTMYRTGIGVAQDGAEAVKWYRKAAEKGNEYAQNRLGLMYQNGYGVAKNYTEAVKWYRKAAEQGDAKGQCHLGHMYRDGKGVDQDTIEASELYHKSAVQGNAECQNSLGYVYYNGKDKDYDKAVRWFRKSAEQGHAPGQYNLGAMYLEGRGGLRKNTRKARAWFRKAAAQGHASAKKALKDL